MSRGGKRELKESTELATAKVSSCVYLAGAGKTFDKTKQAVVRSKGG